jgi:hypothetical protein
VPSPHRLLRRRLEADLLSIHRVDRCDVDEMIHATRRDLDLFAFHTEHCAHMFPVGALDFHVLFDLRSIDHGDTSAFDVAAHKTGPRAGNGLVSCSFPKAPGTTELHKCCLKEN